MGLVSLTNIANSNHPLPYLALSLPPFFCHDPCPTKAIEIELAENMTFPLLLAQRLWFNKCLANLVLSTPFLLLFISAPLFITVPLFISLFVPVLPVAIVFTASTAVTSVSFTIPRGEE